MRDIKPRTGPFGVRTTGVLGELTHAHDENDEIRRRRRNQAASFILKDIRESWNGIGRDDVR